MSMGTQTTELVALAERATLGAALESRAAYERVAKILDGSAFAEPRHELIWEAITWVNEQGTPEDPATADEVLVAMRLHQLGQLDQVGGALYLDDLVAASVLPSNASYYARQVKQAAKARALSVLGIRMQQAGTATGDGGDDVDAVISGALAQLEELDTPTDGAGLRQTPFDDALDLLAGEADVGIPTGLVDLDAYLAGGLKPGRVYVIAARPGVGKTAVAVQIALNAASRGTPVGLFSLEMALTTDLAPRLIANRARVNLDRLEGRSLSDADWVAISGALPELVALPLEVDDAPRQTPATLAAQVGAFVRRHRGHQGLVIIDYLQLVAPADPRVPRQEQVAATMRAVKELAKRHGVPIVLLSQLNREVEGRSGGKPQLSDLRESGAIEQDADAVIMLSDPTGGEAHHERAGELDVAIRKNRAGRVGDIALATQMHHAAVADLARPSDRAA